LKIFQAGAFVGFRVTSAFAVVLGKSETFLFPDGAPVKGLPTWKVSTASAIGDGWSLFTPVSKNEREVTAGLELGFTF
jgi:hypothetical protein